MPNAHIRHRMKMKKMCPSILNQRGILSVSGCDHCTLYVHLSQQALILFFYSWKVTNPIPHKDKIFLKYHMVIISISGTQLCSRGMNNLPRGGQNQEWSPYSAWRLDDYLVPGCWRPAGGRYRYCFVCLTTGLVQVVSGGPTCVIHQASEVHTEV